jgi:PAS domain S-box-containing protein
MPGRDSPAEPITDLRRRAEQSVRDGPSQIAAPAALSMDDAHKALHELHVHQFELEMQNEELRRAQLELDGLRARYFDLYNLAPVGYFTVNERGRMAEVNTTAASMLGEPRDELMGRLLTRFISNDDQDTYHHLRQHLLDTGQRQSCELQMVRHDGHVFWAHLDAGVEPSGNGLRMLRIAMGDVSLRKGAEADRERLARALAERELRAQELAAAESARVVAERNAQELSRLLGERDELLGLLAHEVLRPLNNASTVLRGLSSALEAGEPSPSVAGQLEAAQRVLANVAGSVGNTLVISSQLALADRIKIQDADIDLVIGLALGDLGARERARVRVVRASRARTVELNVELFRMALRNLLGNALTYSPAGSSVELRVEFTDEPLALIVEVADRGDGIAPELLPAIFQRGTRGPRAASMPGAGLGLYVVARVVEMHAGRVEVRANVPHGTVFRTVLPQGSAGPPAWE